jgi:hypothetical protein
MTVGPEDIPEFETDVDDPNVHEVKPFMFLGSGMQGDFRAVIEEVEPGEVADPKATSL